MTRSTNARVAGAAYLLYIAAAFPAMIVMGRARSGQGVEAQLASLAAHAADVRLATILALFGCFMALVLAVTLHAVTRDEDRDLALLGLTCRTAEGVFGAVSVSQGGQLLWLATVGGAQTGAATQALGAYLMHSDMGWSTIVSATFFAVGSTAFCWLLLRGGLIPRALAWLGVFASALLVVGLVLQLGGLISGLVAQLMWIPMAAFEIPGGIWLLLKGVPESGSPPAPLAR